MKTVKVMKFSEPNLEMLNTTDFNSDVEIPKLELNQFIANGFSEQAFQDRTGYRIIEID